MADIAAECYNCGGTDFYNEAGFYYCTECQTQSQQVQEHAFEIEAPQKVTKKIQSASKAKAKVDNKITSWECYNYILVGLTDELIVLGAQKSLKRIVRILWLRYLEKMEVFKRDKNELPKLQAVNSKIDGEIIYGKRKKPRRKASTKSSSDELDTVSATLDSSSMRRQRLKKRRALAEAHYDELTQKSQGTSSLHNETLTSLNTNSDTASNKTRVSYNVYAARELLRKQSRYHLMMHRNDFDQNLKCHRLSYRKVSYRYRTGPHILSPNKLYAILYLGLLINKDQIQLGDILRFINEGHLSFNCFSHFFPDEFSQKFVNFRNYKKNSLFSPLRLRLMASNMAEFLEVDGCIPCPNLLTLCQRFCKELNLPDEISDCVRNIISRSGMKMSFHRRGRKVPNYEGRALSVILFTLKLLFGLDDVTEFELSSFAQTLNKSQAVVPKMFDVAKWLQHIEYRNLLMNHLHFPTAFSNDINHKKIDSFLDFLSKRPTPELQYNRERDGISRVLTKLKSQLPNLNPINFEPSFTPFSDYSKVLLEHADHYQILSEEFASYSVVFLLKPTQFLEAINEDMGIIHGGANDNWVVEPLICRSQQLKRASKQRKKLVTVKLSLRSCINDQKETSSTEIDVDSFRSDFDVENENLFRKNLKLVKRASKRVDFDFDDIRSDLENVETTYLQHYQPSEKYWIRSRMSMDMLGKKDCSKFLQDFPNNFRIVFKDCQRIAQQTEHDMLIEFQLTELHLAFRSKFLKKGCIRIPEQDSLRRFLRNTAGLW